MAQFFSYWLNKGFVQLLIFKFVTAVALTKGCEMATMTASAVMVDALSRLQSLALKCAVISASVRIHRLLSNLQSLALNFSESLYEVIEPNLPIGL